MFNYICKYLLRAANSLERSVIVMQPQKLRKGKGKNKTAHTPTGIAKARRVARKNRNKKRSK
ncbi:hypothetical protein A9G48_04915 [Gilliamella sp. wkB18]|uniref:hypothetical protein n=1 Tax=unclassified Gilliamella TaxID=2685620 RepID=UPI00080E9320|nr:hypothetical protein [Gilliamella apicola]OCG31500.1 hypothetical protein A9G33_00220 [Gilliamella apicola]OCG63801.1 hypothetical protein A9G48_04915 [Gilliamella apicola]